LNLEWALATGLAKTKGVERRDLRADLDPQVLLRCAELDFSEPSTVKPGDDGRVGGESWQDEGLPNVKP
jgi:hypothetical protein